MPVINSNGIQLYYEEQGSGEPLLLIMGITAPGAVWEKHVAHWQQQFRCITVDNRGVGQSDTPDGPYTTAQMADDYAGLLDALNLQKVRVVGVSMGSTIAQQLAIRHPSKVVSMVLMCPWARCDNMAKAVFQHMIDCKANFTPEAFSLFIQWLIFSKSSWDDPAISEGMAADRQSASTEPPKQSLKGLKAQAAACIAHNVLDQLPQIQQPVLVIGGSADIFTPPWMTTEVARAIPNADLHMYEGCGHAFHWEQLSDFNERINQWLLNH
ncbi:alpha/beta fold hydrolase [Flavihumibacter fluvii]|uniref:alpha/beta fold hydrolase n=1 Tax=Flavihumibacter fluvii TaxID=2838157 RepID=UPI001BDE59CE|nr:alpha/beta hydrolase [Flavihumibacter fluvii]ULQ54053.1 alpha/beta hydrolase [Flavihumibacter fluvii]